jgi:hypothetical protein
MISDLLVKIVNVQDTTRVTLLSDNTKPVRSATWDHSGKYLVRASFPCHSTVLQSRHKLTCRQRHHATQRYGCTIPQVHRPSWSSFSMVSLLPVMLSGSLHTGQYIWTRTERQITSVVLCSLAPVWKLLCRTNKNQW